MPREEVNLPEKGNDRHDTLVDNSPLLEVFKKQDEDEEKDQQDENEETSKEPEAPAVDENGRLLFRKQATSSKRKLQSIIDEEIQKSDKASLKPKKKKAKSKSKPTSSSLLSFEQDDE